MPCDCRALAGSGAARGAQNGGGGARGWRFSQAVAPKPCSEVRVQRLLLDLPVSVNVRNRNERRELPGVQLPESVERTTFRSLHERAHVAHAGPRGMSPFRRALVLQSILARAKACHNGWPDAPPELTQLDDAVSPNMSPEKEETVRAWRVAAAAAGSAAVAGREEDAR
jgi:hypothetical protein